MDNVEVNNVLALKSDAEFFEWVKKTVGRVGVAAHQLENRVETSREYKLASLVDFFVEIKMTKDLLDAVVKQINAMHQRMAYNVMPEKFEEEQITSFTTESGYRVTTSSLVRASVNADFDEAVLWVNEANGDFQTEEPAEYSKYWVKYTGKQAGYKWLEVTGNGAIIQETVNASTLSSFAKGELAEMRELPPSLFNVHVASNTSVTKTKKG